MEVNNYWHFNASYIALYKKLVQYCSVYTFAGRYDKVILMHWCFSL